jgi:hypothetical protein
MVASPSAVVSIFAFHFRGRASLELKLVGRARAFLIRASTPQSLGTVHLNLPRFFLTGRGGRAVCNFHQSPEQKDCVCSLSHTQMIGEIAVPTANEYRLRAHECLELTNEADQWYVKTALLKLAAEFQKRAERLERSNEGQ